MATVGPENVAEVMQQEGCASLQFRLGPDFFKALFSMFGEVVADSEGPNGERITRALTFKLEGRERDGDYYLAKRFPGDIHPVQPDRARGTEHKYTAHIGPLSLAHAIREFGSKVPRNLGILFALCGELHEETKATVRPVYEKFGLADLMLARDPTNDVHIIRLLRYLHTTKEEPKAALHFDRAVAALALYESMEGLVGGPADNGQIRQVDPVAFETTSARAASTPVSHAPYEAKFFWGAGRHHLPPYKRRPLDRIPLFAHGVSNVDPSAERDAAVVFMNPHLGVPYSPPSSDETGLREVRARILRHRPPHDDE